jgi:hypothetical protein
LYGLKQNLPLGLALICTAVLWPDYGFAKLKIYRCQSETGQVVIQDKACRITDLLNDSSNQKVKKSPKTNSKPFNQSKSKTPQSRRNTFAAASNQKQAKNAKHFLKSIDQDKWQHQLLAKDFGWQLSLANGYDPRATGLEANITITHYNNTRRYYGRDAFAQALHFYHRIRNTGKLQDSQFVSHPDYKAFNVSYFSSGDRAYTEYYIHRNRPELWVITAQSKPRDWPLIWADFVKIKAVL